VLRRWIGAQIIALGVRIMGDAVFPKTLPEEDDEDEEVGSLMTMVRANEKAQQMVAEGRQLPRPKVKEPPILLVGSLADRARREQRLRRR
jgi:hypothetical protein